MVASLRLMCNANHITAVRMNKTILNVRITPEEQEILKRAAAKAGRTKTEIIRELIRSLERKRRAIAPENRNKQTVAVAAPVQDDSGTSENVVATDLNGRRGRKADSKVTQFSDAFIGRHCRAPTGKELRAQFPDMPRQTAHDYSVRARAAMLHLRIVAD
jgi:hypothetical protein